MGVGGYSGRPILCNGILSLKAIHDKTLMEKGNRGADWSTYLLPFDEKLGKDKRFKDVNDRNYVHEPKLFGTLDKKEDLREQFNMLCRGEKVMV